MQDSEQQPTNFLGVREADNVTPPQEASEGKLRSLAEIEQELSEIEVAQDAIDPEFQALDEWVAGLPPDQAEIVSTAFDQVVYERVSVEGVLGSVPAEFHDRIREFARLLSQGETLQIRWKMVDEERVPHLRVELEALVASLSGRVDYQALLQGETRHLYQDSADLQILWQCQYLLKHGSQHLPVNSHFLHSRLQYFKDATPGWEAHGLLQKEAAQDVLNTSNLQEASARAEFRQQLIQKLDETVEHLARYRYLAGMYIAEPQAVYRASDLKLQFLAKNLAYQPSSETDNLLFQEMDFSPEFLAAAAQFFQQRVEMHSQVGMLPRTQEQELAAQEKSKALSVEQAISQIEFKGFEVPAGKVPVITADELRSELRTVIPPDFLFALRSLSFVPEGPDADTMKDLEEGLRVVGLSVPVLDKDALNLIATEIEIYHPLFTDEDTPEPEKEYMRNQFLDTVWHEIGHNSHYTLSYDEMLQWEETISSDPTAVSWYVEYSRQKGEKKGRIEDFAESYQLFIRNPTILHMLSPVRYYFMLRYFDRHMPDAQMSEFSNRLKVLTDFDYKEWTQSGLIEADIIAARKQQDGSVE